MASSKKFKIVTLGCRTNQYESQAYHSQLESLGYTKAEDGEYADICIVNTCTVTESADTSSKYQIRQLAKKNPNSKIIVTGCSADRQPDVLRQIEGVTNVVANKDKENLLKVVFPNEELPEFNIKRFDAHTRAFVKVQDGCNSFCSYCIIPYVRGRSRSRTIPEIINEVIQLVDSGYKEIVLTGINIGDFDGNDQYKLADLVRKIDAIEGIERVRVSSIDPDEVDEDLLDAIINGKHTCHSMHVVLQSGSNVVLKRMNRKYTRQIFFDTVDRLRKASPRFSFTTDIIVGFPGETEIDHQDTLDAIREARFIKVHSFPYSDRPGTKSSAMPNKVPSDVISRRKQEILRLSEEVSWKERNKFIGQKMTLLTESINQENPHEICGHTDNFMMVWIPNENLTSNQLVDVELVENRPDGFKGKILNAY